MQTDIPFLVTYETEPENESSVEGMVNLNVLGVSDIAKQLGLSTTTVSRALSGKGRVSQETRRRVKEFTEKNGYVPNSMARSLVLSKSYNFAYVMTGAHSVNASFFRLALEAVCKKANSMSYDIIVVNSDNDEEKELKRIIAMRKADGIITTRELKPNITAMIKEYRIPLILLGYSDDEEINQVDTDVIKSGEDLTGKLVETGLTKIAYIGELGRYTVNQRRLQGFLNACSKNGENIENSIFTFNDTASRDDIDQFVRSVLGVYDCIITNDDIMCLRVMNTLGRLKVSIPDQIKLASFYHDSILDMSIPRITGINHNPKDFGLKAAEILINILEDENFPKQGNKLWIDYELILGEST